MVSLAFLKQLNIKNEIKKNHSKSFVAFDLRKSEPFVTIARKVASMRSNSSKYSKLDPTTEMRVKDHLLNYSKSFIYGKKNE